MRLYQTSAKMYLIKNAVIHDVVAGKCCEGDLLTKGTKILAIGKDLDPEDYAELAGRTASAGCGDPVECRTPAGCEEVLTVLDVDGKDVYPGLVDAHSHLGLDIYGIGYEGDDYNEMTDAVCPQLRGIDSFNPFDPAVAMAAAGGVTCVGTGPGSANVLGGTFLAVKTTGIRVDDMIVKDPVAMKCAFGENPKRIYRTASISARMTIAAKLREMLYKTKEYLAKKEAAEAAGDPSKMPAWDMRLEALIPVVKKELPLKAHAHQANDILTAIRVAKELDVLLTLEHVTEGHLIADELAKEGYPCAVGPSLTHASKFELQNKSWTTPGILAAKGCQVSIITDAPVIPQQHLALCAAMAANAGMDPDEALRAITINPARHLGIADRVGSLEAGKDADLLICSGSPLTSLDAVKTVMINGRIVG